MLNNESAEWMRQSQAKLLEFDEKFSVLWDLLIESESLAMYAERAVIGEESAQAKLTRNSFKVMYRQLKQATRDIQLTRNSFPYRTMINNARDAKN